MIKFHTRAAFLASAAFIADTGALHAQATSAPAASASSAPAGTTSPQSASGDIIVTAQRRSESLREVPVSITAVSGANLQKLGVTGTADLMKVVPGFTFAQSYSGAPIYTLRGVGLNDTTLAAGPTVATYVDEIPLPYAAMSRGAAFDLERVEVLKGPQGTLYGLNSTGGAINYISAKPTKTTEGGGSLSFSRFNTADVNAYLSGPISDTLGFRVAAQTTQGGDWQKSATRNARLGQTDFLQGRAQLSWKPSPSIRFLLMANGWRDRSETQAGQLVAVLPQNPTNVASTSALEAQPITSNKSDRLADWDPGRDYRAKDWFYQFALRGDIDITPDVTLTSLTSYDRYRQNQPRDIDGTALQNLFLTAQGDIKTFTQELRLTGSMGKLKWIAGANYEHDTASEFQIFDNLYQTNNAPAGIPLLHVNLQTRQKAETYAGFANADYEILPRLTLTGGVRYTKANRDFSGCTLDSGSGSLSTTFAIVQSVAKSIFGLAPGPVPQPGGCASLNDNYDAELTRDSLKEHNVSWRGGVKYKPTDDVMLYANVSRGYKSGVFPTVLASRSSEFAPVHQEKLTAYEAGLKFTAFDRKLDVSAAGFYYDYRGKQVRTRFLDPIFFQLEALTNIPKSDVVGGEVQLMARPVRGLTISAAASYTDAKIKKFTGIDQFGVTRDFSDTPVPFTPKWQATADTEYRFPVDAIHEAFVGGTVSYTGPSNAFIGADPIGNLVDRTLLDLRAGFGAQSGAWQFYVWGRNVTDEKYQTFRIRVTDTVIGYAGRPATYGGTIAVKFR